MTDTYRFDWKPFYEELAKKLLTYKDRRNELYQIVQKAYEKLNEIDPKTTMLFGHLENKIEQIDPFTVLASFTRKINNRIEFASVYKDLFNLDAKVPQNFDGLPVVLSMNLRFYGDSSTVETEIDYLWKLFEVAFAYAKDPAENKNDFIKYFNLCLNNQSVASPKLSMGLFWSMPDSFLNLDSTNFDFIFLNRPKTLSFDPPLPKLKKRREIDGEKYLEILNIVAKNFERSDFSVHSFLELSDKAAEAEFVHKNNSNEKETRDYGNNETEIYDDDEDVIPFPCESKNIILYGAPGTGKTYLTQQVLKQFKGNLNGNVDLSIFENMTWWQVLTCALLDMKKHAKVTELIEHPFVASKIKTSMNKVPGAGIHGTLQAHTWEKSNTVKYKNRLNPALFDKDEDSKWFIADMSADEVQELIDILKTSKQIAEDRYRFVTFHPNYSYEDFVEGIKPNLGGEDDEQLSYHLENGIFKSICLRAAQDPTHPYCIVIDEINRGNIPAILGELITLIEEDKRETLSVTLPYSKTKFTVPKNLYIIGTMNTADRSVEAMDIALRRRFEFKEIKPDSSVVNDCEGIKLKEIFETINERIEVLLDADHMIGHSYFMKINNLQEVRDLFKLKIIPLLQEYFYNDYEKICLVLGKKFVKQIELKDIFMKNYDDTDVPTIKYQIVDVDTLNSDDFNSLCEKQ